MFYFLIKLGVYVYYFTSDTKDVDITGAMFVCNNG